MNVPKIITLEEMRSETGIGASEVGAVCHLSPWTTARELWEVKTGRREKDAPTAAMEFGIEMEPVAFKEYCQMTGMDWQTMHTQIPAVHSEIPFLRAIADYWNGAHGCQIKCPSGTSVLESMRRGIVPKHYLLQCVAEMEIFGVDEWDFFVYAAESPSESQLATVRMDDPWIPAATLEETGEKIPGLTVREFWQGTALPLIAEFWRKMCADEWKDSKEWPAPPTDKWLAAVERRKFAADMARDAQELKDEADAELQQMMGFQERMVVGSWEAKWTRRKPSFTVAIKCTNEAIEEEILPKISALEEVDGVDKIEKSNRAESFSFGVKPLTAKGVMRNF